ncbi:LOW QUALITY PROTEIN: hypothetical protein ACHAW6_000349 [Cyclotella cf. meneghiniana]
MEKDIRRMPLIATPWAAAKLTRTGWQHDAANISLLANGAPAAQASVQQTPKSAIQPKGDRLFTTENLLILQIKFPPKAREAHSAPGITNNLISTTTLANAGCKIFFHKTGCEVSLDGEIILVEGPRYLPMACLSSSRRWKFNRSYRSTIFQQLLVHPSPEINSIYECENTEQLINFYYATIGYPVISMWIKAIDKGYFQGWRGLTSDRV